MTPQELLANFEEWVNSQEWNIPRFFSEEELLEFAQAIEIPREFVDEFSKVKSKPAWFDPVANIIRNKVKSEWKSSAGEEDFILHLTDKTGLHTSKGGEAFHEGRQRDRAD